MTPSDSTGAPAAVRHTGDDQPRPATTAVPAPSARRAASAMAVGTLLSRLTGLLRLLALSAALGIGDLQDAFNIGYTVPSMLLVLVTGGTLSAVLVPLLTRDHDPREQRRTAEALGGLVLLVTGVASLLMVAASPLLARLFALNARDDPQYDDIVRVATAFLALMAPQVLIWAASIFATAVLQAHGRLALAGFSPVLTNLIAIASAVLYVAIVSDGGRLPTVQDVPAVGIWVLGLGSTLSVLVMTWVQLAGARRVLPGLRVRPRVRWGHPANRELRRLGRWTVLLVVANQGGLLLVLVLAKGVDGGVTAYQSAFMVMQLPFAVIAVSLFSALYPRLTRAAADTTSGDGPRTFDATLAQGLRLGSLLLLPCGVGLLLLADPVAKLLLDYGAATGRTDLVAAALRLFGVSLLPFTVFNLLTRAHYALGDARTPATVTLAQQATGVAVAVAAFVLASSATGRLAALALGHAAGFAVGCALLAASLRRSHREAFSGTGTALLRSVAGAGLMALALAAAAAALPAADSQVELALRTLGLVAVGGASYLLACLLLRTRELRELVTLRRP
ncbi:MAG: hypothetical protein M3P95_06225 [Actinomycetota bacterium]|jgi:putative peptidoglycan lipid II flippase|nr:hypothetical protein [Actinomycetota bacterium]